MGKRCRHRHDCRDGSGYAQIPGNRRHSTWAGPPGETLRLVRRPKKKSREKVRAKAFIVVFAGRNEARQAVLGLIRLNNFKGSDVGTPPSCLVELRTLGPEPIRAGGKV